MKGKGRNWYACSVCGASFSAPGGTVGPLKCWRDDCPGREKREPPSLKVVK